MSRFRTVFAVCWLAALLAVWMRPATSEVPIGILEPGPDVDSILALVDIDLPPSGESLLFHADFPADSPFVLGDEIFLSLTAILTDEGEVRVQSAQTADATDPSGADGAIGPCRDRTYAATGPKWRKKDLPLRWRFKRTSTPSHLDRMRTQRRIMKAHQIWGKALSRCRRKESSMGFRFVGVTGKSLGRNGVNSVDFGPLSSGALAMNYIWFSGNRMLETDLRLNSAYHWTHKKGGTGFHVLNVAAHEIGHQVGLDDLGGPHYNLTMFGRIRPGETKKARLGRGDMRGAARIYP